MTVEVICALITVGGVAFSALISYEDEFAGMASAVAKFVDYNNPRSRAHAMEQVAAIRSKEVGVLGRLLDELYLSVQSGNTSEADIRLSQVIDQKREAKSKSNASNRN